MQDLDEKIKLKFLQLEKLEKLKKLELEKLEKLKRLEEIIIEIKRLSFEAASIGKELNEKVFIMIPSSVHIEYSVEDEDLAEYWQPSGGYSCW